MPDFLGFIGDALGGLFGWLADNLPQSPFADITLDGATGDALGWLNWVVPFGDIMALFAAWLAVVLVVWGVRFVIKHVISKTLDKVA